MPEFWEVTPGDDECGCDECVAMRAESAAGGTVWHEDDHEDEDCGEYCGCDECVSTRRDDDCEDDEFCKCRVCVETERNIVTEWAA